MNEAFLLRPISFSFRVLVISSLRMKTMGQRSLLLVYITLFATSFAYAFGQDVCFAPEENTTTNQIVNCIGVGQNCRTSHLSHAMEKLCRLAATRDSLNGLNGSTVVGGRSLVHTDATYIMAQLIGFTPWQAYEMAIYSEATDQSFYTPFAQNGSQLLSNEELDTCQAGWSDTMSRNCLLTTPEVNGLSRFNASTGGMWLHLHARYSEDGQALPTLPFPVDYLAPEYAKSEKLLNDFHAWVFDQKSSMCVYGITQNKDSNSCAEATAIIESPVNLGPLKIAKLSIPFVTPLGTFVINDNEQNGKSPVLAEDDSLQSYLSPQEAAYAKMGIFVHALADRYSHHMCSDRSYFFQAADDNYHTVFCNPYCAQGSHFLWHVWEQGTAQNDANLDTNFQTIRPALDAVYTQLLSYAQHRGIRIQTLIDRDTLINRLTAVLSIYDPSERLTKMVQLTEDYQLLPLPGHGSVSNISNDAWLTLAGAPVV